MNSENRTLYLIGGTLLAILALSWVASYMLFLWEGIDPIQSRPWSLYQVLLDSPEGSKINARATLTLFGAVVLTLIVVVLGPFYKPKGAFGDAKWASKSDMKRAGMLGKKGVILGKAYGKYVCSDVPTHTLLLGPTRAGKGTGVVIPNCLNWNGSLVVFDVKGENHAISSGFREKAGQSVFFWSVMAKDKLSHRFNPLDQISSDPAHRITDLQIMATLLVEVSDRDPMWGMEARALFTGAALFVIEHRQIKTLGEVYRFIAAAENLKDLCKRILDTTSDLSAEVSRSLGSFSNKSEREAAGVRSTLLASLRLFENPVVDAATSASDFNVADLRRKRISIYVGVLASQLETAAPLMRLFFQQVMSVLSEAPPGPDEPHQVLMLLDEFPSIGPINAVVSAFTLLAGYGVRVLAVAQGLSWLDRTYGHDTRDGIISCCGHQIFMATNDETTSQYVSKALGERTVSNQSVTKRPFAMSQSTPSKNVSVIGRPLMTPEAIRRLDASKQIIIREGHRPAMVRKVQYFTDKAFKPRLVPRAIIPELKIKRSKAKPFLPLPPSKKWVASNTAVPPENTPPPPAPETRQEAPETAGEVMVAPTRREQTSEDPRSKLFRLLEAEYSDNPDYRDAYDEQKRLAQIDPEKLP